MTATDELRALLDERGVEWEDHSDEDVRHTVWNGAECWFTEFPDGWTALGVSKCGTPAKAVEATLGRGTCRYNPDYSGFTWWDKNDVEHYEEDSANEECWSASCDKCGFTMTVGDEGWFNGWDDIKVWDDEDGTEHHGILLEPIFKFCPNCGCEVVQS